MAQLTFLWLRVAFRQQDRGPARLGPRAHELETSPRTGRLRPGLLRCRCAGSRSPGLGSAEAWGRLTQQGGPGQDTGCDSEQRTPESHVHGTSYGGVSSQAPAPRSPPAHGHQRPGRAGLERLGDLCGDRQGSVETQLRALSLTQGGRLCPHPSPSQVTRWPSRPCRQAKRAADAKPWGVLLSGTATRGPPAPCGAALLLSRGTHRCGWAPGPEESVGLTRPMCPGLQLGRWLRLQENQFRRSSVRTKEAEFFFF